MPDRALNAFYFAAYRCQASRRQITLSHHFGSRERIQAAYEAWIANGQDPRIKLRFDGDQAVLEYDEEAA